MIYNLAYKDVFYNTTADTFTYVIRLGDTGVFFATAVKSPGDEEISININRIVSQYLDTNMPDFRNYSNNVTKHGNGVLDFNLYQVTFNEVTVAGQTTKVAVETLVETYRFLVGYDYGDTWNGGRKILSNPVNGVMDPRMKLFFSSYNPTTASTQITSVCGVTGGTPTTGSTPSWDSGGTPDTPVSYTFSILGGNGARMNSTVGTWEIDYSTNYPSIYYVFSGATGVQTGYTSGNAVSFYIPANTGATRTWSVQFYPEMGGALLTGATATQTSSTGDTPYTFTFYNTDGEQFSAFDRRNTVSWNSSYPSVAYSLFRNGSLIASGSSSQSAVTVNFPENTDTTTGVSYSFVASYMGAQIGTLTWYQDAAEEPVDYYFNFTTRDYAVLDSGTTAYTINWETNYPSVIYMFGSTAVSTSDSGCTVTFPVSTQSSFELSVYSPYGEILGTIHWRRIVDFSREYLTIEPISDGVLGVYCTQYTPLYYSTDDGATWNELEPFDTVGVYGIHNRVLLKGTNAGFQIKRGYTTHCQYNVYGNIMSVIYGDNFIGKTNFDREQGFEGVFSGTNVYDASNLVLPVINLPKACYRDMFCNCHELMYPPKLPSTNLSDSCYKRMFFNCWHLMYPPELPALFLTSECYFQMFSECYSMRTAPDLPAETLVELCYHEMFSWSGVESVKCLAKYNVSTYNTNHWLAYLGDPKQGTFTKASGVTWERGIDGIPDGWSIIEV